MCGRELDHETGGGGRPNQRSAARRGTDRAGQWGDPTPSVLLFLFLFFSSFLLFVVCFFVCLFICCECPALGCAQTLRWSLAQRRYSHQFSSLLGQLPDSGEGVCPLRNFN